jgi:hypothetical protein
MSLRGWFRRRKSERRWRRAERREHGPLREFVYLDEVSVYSLVASQVGLVVTEVTDTQASSLQSEVSSGLGVSTPVKAEIGSKIQASDSQSSQVLRKAIIQTTFKQLRETAERSGALRLRADADASALHTLDDVRRLAQADERSSLVVPSARLRRGDLIEMDVQLEAEPIYQAGMAMSGVLEIIEDDPAAFGMSDVSQLAQLRLVSRMLDKVLAGLIPVRGRAVNFEAVQVDGEDWLLRTDLIGRLAERAPRTPVFLVGVAQQGLFWKDVRRVLFSGSEYRVLARLNRSGLQEAWTPVKLVDVLSSVVPDFAEVMDTVNRGVLSAMSSAVTAQQSTSTDHRVRAAVLAYAAMLADRAGVDVTEAELDHDGLLSHKVVHALGVREWREMLAPVTGFIEQRSGETFSREVAADYRVAAVTQAGLLDSSPPAVAVELEAGDGSERFLDSEIIAVYW